MKNIANVVLANPFNVPNAIPIFRWRVGVTRICSAIMIAENMAAPVHVSQFCGRNDAYQTKAAILTTCSAVLMPNAVRVENLAGIECRPFLRSNSWS